VTNDGGILAEIGRRKRWERDILRDALRGNLRVNPDSDWMPSEQLLAQARHYLKEGGCEGHRRPFAPRLSDDNQLSVIAEIKRRSPSAGTFADWEQPEGLAAQYQEGGAAVISVLTDAHFFGGRPEFVARTREVFTGPVLRKDFLADEADLALSAAMKADAVLLIVRLLGTRTAELIRLARCYDLETLVEVHDERELDLAMASGAPVVGINNRDLDDFSVDLGRSEELMARIPRPIAVVSESGISSSTQALRMRRAGADAILVGQALAERGGEGLGELRVEAARGHRP
jgi:indole-3-glycerol phosphate synthase